MIFGLSWLGAAGSTLIADLPAMDKMPLAVILGFVAVVVGLGYAQFTWLAVVAIVNTVLSLAVYLRIIVPMYRAGNVAPAAPDPWLGTVVIAAFAATFIIGLAFSRGWGHRSIMLNV